MATAYIPEAGDIVWLQFTPQTGHEQAVHRPALVLSPAAYNGKTGLMLCCQLTAPVAFLGGDIIALVAPCLLLMAGLTDDIATLGVRMGCNGPRKRGAER